MIIRHLSKGCLSKLCCAMEKVEGKKASCALIYVYKKKVTDTGLEKEKREKKKSNQSTFTEKTLMSLVQTHSPEHASVLLVPGLYSVLPLFLCQLVLLQNSAGHTGMHRREGKTNVCQHFMI